MRFIGGILVGVLLAFGLASAHETPISSPDHHEDCDEDYWAHRPGWWMRDHDWSATLDPDSPHDTIEVRPGVCLSDVSLLHVAVEVFRYDGSWQLTTAHATNWHVGDDGLAVKTLTHLAPETEYRLRLRSGGSHRGDRELVTAAAPTETTTTTTTTTTTLPECVMPTTTTTTTTTSTTVAPETVIVPSPLAEGATKAQAEQLVIDAGLVPAFVPVATAVQTHDGVLISQGPAGGTVVAVGSTVTFEYYSYVPPEG